VSALGAETLPVAAYEVVPFELVFPETSPATLRPLVRLHLTIARAELAPVTFAVRSHTHAREVTARIIAPRNGRAVLPAEQIDLRVVKVWEQSSGRATAADEKDMFRVPELLLTDDLIDPVERWEGNVYTAPRFPDALRTELLPGQMKQFWLTVRAAAETESGTYVGAIELCSRGTPFLRVPLAVTVLPYVLPEPGKIYSIYFRPRVSAEPLANFHHMPKERYLAELRSLKAHGFNSLIVYEGDPACITEAYRRIESVGFSGPIVFTSRGAEAQQQVVKLTQKSGKDAWLYGIDEPGAKQEARHVELCRQIHAAGGKVMTALRTDMCRRLDRHSPLDWANLSHVYIPSTVVSREYAGRPETRNHPVRHQLETHYWQSWSERPLANRVNTGFYLWRSGLDGAAPFCTAAFQKCLPYHEDVRGFPPQEPKRRMRVFATYYPGDPEPTPTLQYEALREGIDDLRYLRLADDLMRAIEREGPAAVDKLQVARTRLKQILDPFFYKAVPSAGHFAWARSSLVLLIAYLRGDTDGLRAPLLRPTLTRAKRFTVGPSVGNECADVMIQEGSRESRGRTNWFAVGVVGENIRRRALLRFELPPVPPNARVRRAALTMSPCGIYAPNRPRRALIAVHRVLAPWSEDECTWSERVSGGPWNSPGGDFAGEPESEAEADKQYGKVSWDLTRTVQAWYGAPSTNHGLLLKLSSEDASQYRNAHLFASSDTTNSSNYRWWPSLLVEME